MAVLVCSLTWGWGAFDTLQDTVFAVRRVEPGLRGFSLVDHPHGQMWGTYFADTLSLVVVVLCTRSVRILMRKEWEYEGIRSKVRNEERGADFDLL